MSMSWPAFCLQWMLKPMAALSGGVRIILSNQSLSWRRETWCLSWSNESFFTYSKNNLKANYQVMMVSSGADYCNLASLGSNNTAKLFKFSSVLITYNYPLKLKESRHKKSLPKKLVENFMQFLKKLSTVFEQKPRKFLPERFIQFFKSWQRLRLTLIMVVRRMGRMFVASVEMRWRVKMMWEPWLASTLFTANVFSSGWIRRWYALCVGILPWWKITANITLEDVSLLITGLHFGILYLSSWSLGPVTN